MKPEKMEINEETMNMDTINISQGVGILHHPLTGESYVKVKDEIAFLREIQVNINNHAQLEIINTIVNSLKELL